MFSNRFNSNKCKTQCRLCISRIKLMRNKKNILLKQIRREIADLLRNGKQENARIRVEAVIREKLLLQAYDVLELFLELLAVRVQLVERASEPPPDMIEALSSLLYAAQRVQDFPELLVIRHLLGSKFGKDYASEASSDVMCRKWHVNENLIRFLAIEAPQPEDKLATLSEIAQEFSIDWDAHSAAQQMLPSDRQYLMAGGATVSHQQDLLDLAGLQGPSAPAGQPAAPAPWSGPSQQWAPTPAPTQPAPPPERPVPPPPQQQQPPKQAPPFARANSASRERFYDPPNDSVQGGWKAPKEQRSQQPPAEEHDPRYPAIHPLSPPSETDLLDLDDGMPAPDPPQEQYQDARAAAAAARKYSEEARQAAEAAARWADAGRSDSGSPMRRKDDDLSEDTGSPVQGQGGGPLRFGAKGGFGSVVHRTDNDIQRAYDAVPGPPSKGQAQQGGPPSAPPVAPPPPNLAETQSDDFANGLPKPPTAMEPVEKPSKPDDMLDELQKRFEQLKRR